MRTSTIRAGNDGGGLAAAAVDAARGWTSQSAFTLVDLQKAAAW